MEEKIKIFFCEDDENLGMLLRENTYRQKGILPICSQMEKPVIRALQKRNMTFVC